MFGGLLGALGLLLASISCSSYREPVSRPAPILNMKGGCLGEAGSTLEQFFRGQASTLEVAEFWQCLDVTLQKFYHVTYGQQPGIYSAEEIREFLRRYFVSGDRLTDPLFAEIMELKRLLIGGSVEHITLAEWGRLRGVMQELRRISLQLNPHMLALQRDSTGPWGQKEDLDLGSGEQVFVEASQALNQAAGGLGRLLGRTQLSYSRLRLEALMGELDRIFSLNLSPWLPLWGQVKEVVVGGSAEVMQAEEWEPLLGLLSRAYGQYVLWNLIHDQGENSSPQALRRWDRWMAESLSLSAGLLRSQPEETLSWNRLESLWAELESLGFLPFAMDQPQWSQLLQTVVCRFLQPDCEGEGTGSPSLGFGLEHLAQIRVLYEDWRQGQASVDRLMRSPERGGETSALHPRLQELLAGPWPLVQDRWGRLQLTTEARVFDRRRDLETLNGLGFLLQRLMGAYAAAPSGEPLSMDRLQLKRAFTELHPLWQSLGLISFESGDEAAMDRFVSKVMRDASLFMPRSQGGDRVHLPELVEFASFALSGLRASQKVFRELQEVEHCPRWSSEGEFLGLDPVTCLRPLLFGRRDQYLQHLPHLRQYLDQGDLRLWELFERQLQLTVRPGAGARQPVSTGELTEMMVLMKYIETFFLRFDQNGNGTINLPESLEAFPLFFPTLQALFEAIGFEPSEEEVLAFFTFLFKEGRTPFDQPDSFEDWLDEPDLWEYEADRLILARILASLSLLTTP